MAVYLQFSVLPDGSVTSVIPLRKSDELLEREAVAALRTWRFEPLPEQIEQKTQTGKITFNFKLE
jgi:TonB family protein